MKQLNFLMCTMILSLLFLFSCDKDESKPDPIAAFQVSKSTVLINETITFLNTSKDANEYLWDFGDGNTSTDKDPIHWYSESGDYKVTLKAISEERFNSTSSRVTIVYPSPVASFTTSKKSAITAEKITFTNESEEATEYLWDFGDGQTSSDENPTHAFYEAGNYTVSLTTTGKGGENVSTLNIDIETGEFNIIPGKGITDISFGDTWAKVKEYYSDQNYIKYGRNTDGYPIEYQDLSLRFYFASVTGYSYLRDEAGLSYLYLQGKFEGRTEKGIKMGSTLSDVLAAYGEPDKIDGRFHYYNIGIQFECDYSFDKIWGIDLFPPKE